MVKKLVGEAAIFFFALFFEKGMSLILLPVVTRTLTKSDYGVFELVVTSYNVFNVLASLCLVQSVGRFISEWREEGKEKRFFSSLFNILLFNLIIICGIAWGGREHFFGGTVPLFAVFCWFISNSIRDFLLGYVKFSEQAKWYVLDRLIVAGCFLFAVLVVYYQGVLDAQVYLLLKSVLCVLSIFALCWRRFGNLYTFVVDKKAISISLSFSLPLACSSLCLLGYKVLDRWMIAYFLNTEAVASYSAALKLANCFQMISVAISSAMLPVIYKKHQDPDFPRVLAKLFYMYNLLGVACVSVAWFLKKYVFLYVLPESYQSSEQYVLSLLILNIVSSYYLFLPGLNIQKKTVHVFFVNIFSLLFAGVANFMAIPSWGVWGAIVASFLTVLFSQFAYCNISYAQYPVEHNYNFGLFLFATFFGGIVYYSNVF